MLANQRHRTVGTRGSAGIDEEKLLLRILQARPWATALDVVRIAPILAQHDQKQLEARMTRLRQRTIRGRSPRPQAIRRHHTSHRREQ